MRAAAAGESELGGRLPGLVFSLDTKGAVRAAKAVPSANESEVLCVMKIAECEPCGCQ